jgi:hypothetical protein
MPVSITLSTVAYAIGQAIGTVIGLYQSSVLFAMAANFAISYTVNRVFGAKPPRQQDNGVRQQVPPSADNSIPVVYGEAWMGGTFVDAVLTTDNQAMYYVLAISNISPNGQFTFDTTQFYYGDRLITFAPGTNQVASLTDGAGNVDTKINGYLYINLYTSTTGGAITPVLGTAPNVAMGGADIPASLRWPSSGRQMNGLAFAIVYLKYSTDAGSTGLQPLTFRVKHALNGTGVAKPGSVLKDYLTNTVYGGAVPLANVNTTACDDLDTYSDQTITYTPSGGGSATQARYRINGVLDTGETVLNNIENILIACDSWIGYQAESGQWAPIINKAESTGFAFDDSNIIGDIRVSATDITSSINEVELSFPWKENKDKPGFVYLSLWKPIPSPLLYPNEPVNKYTATLSMVNDSVQAQYLGNRMLEQAREDLVVSFNTAYTGIQVNAGDVVSVTNAAYGWTNKLFRVIKVNEASLPDGNLGARFELSEYNAQVYDDMPITAFTPAPNSDLQSGYYFPTLSAPTFTDQAPSVQPPTFSVVCQLPSTVRVTRVTLYYTTSASPAPSDWKVWNTESASNAAAFAPGLSLKFPNVNLAPATYYFAFSVENEVSISQLSTTSAAFVWSPTSAVGPTGPTGSSGATGGTGNKTGRAVVYQWAITIPAGPTGTSTYTWATGNISPVPAGWSTTITVSPSAGFTLWAATVNLIATDADATSTINWATASILSAGYAGVTGPTGTTGPTGSGTNGASSRICFARVPNNPAPVSGNITTSGSASFPSSAQSLSTWGFAATWGASDPNPSSTDSLYQSDGIYDPNTGNTVWTTPYISSLKVGTLSAITVNTGALTVQNTLTINTLGKIQGGQTDYNTGTGFFLGYSGGAYKFSIGSTTQSLLWDGSTLNITGNFVGKSALFNGSTTSGSSTATVIIKPSTTSGANSLTVEGTGAGYAIGVSSDSTTTPAISSQGFWYGVEGIGFAPGTTRAAIGVRGIAYGQNTVGGQFEESGESTSLALKAVGKAVITGDLTVNGSTVTTNGGYIVLNGTNGAVQAAGGSSVTVALSGRFSPTTDNTTTCGGVGARWSVVYAATGTINTSDERDKTILGSSLGLSFINALEPVSYKWKIGGVDAEGNPRPGVRTFHGLKAQQVKATLDSLGVDDFAGWVLNNKDDDQSTQGLRYTEFIAPLIKAVQELSQKVADLEAKLK